MNIKSFTLLLLILLIGIFFRFFGLNWDQGFHLHPDERFLTMVAVASKLPTDFLSYLNPAISPLNPTNNHFDFYVYGILPITLTKILAIFTHMNTYDTFTILGRFLSALFDTLTIVLVFLIAKVVSHKNSHDNNVPLFSAFFYAIAVLPIQLAHFFAVDIFLNFFVMLCIYFLLLLARYKNIVWLPLSAVAFGIALSCKVTALAITPLIILMVLVATTNGKIKKISTWIDTGIFLLLYVGIAYLTLRITDPYMFADSNFFNPFLNQSFLHSIRQLIAYSSPTFWYPPNVQWMTKAPVIFALENIAFFGLGIPYFLISIFGLFLGLQKRNFFFITLTVWVVLFFLYQSMQFSKTMRYFIFLYPFCALFAGYAFSYIRTKLNRYFVALFGILFLSWPLMFLNIYTKQHTRVAASYWITQNIPPKSTILTEYWDDPLPLQVPTVLDREYKGIELHVFDEDTQEKWQIMNQQLAQGNYLILSSNRGWGSIPTVPQKYPLMTKFYADLFAGKLPYKKVASFISEPSLRYMGIPIYFPDDWAEEAFTVYDHPTVVIFKKE